MVLALVICLLWKLVNKDYLLRASGWFIEFFVDFSFCNQCLHDQHGRRILKIGTWNCASFHREIPHKCFPAFSQNCCSILQQEKWQRHEPKKSQVGTWSSSGQATVNKDEVFINIPAVLLEQARCLPKPLHQASTALFVTSSGRFPE